MNNRSRTCQKAAEDSCTSAYSRAKKRKKVAATHKSQKIASKTHTTEGRRARRLLSHISAEDSRNNACTENALDPGSFFVRLRCARFGGFA